MTPTDYRKILQTATDTILMAKQAAKDHSNMPIIKQYATKMIFNAYQVQSTIVDEANKEYPFINWMGIATGKLNEKGAIMSLEDKRLAKINSLIPHRAPKD